MNNSEISNKFSMANRRLLLLDYDGTLVNIASTPDKAQPTQEALNVLAVLNKKQNTDTFIITGRSYPDIKAFLENPGLQIIAEHGSSHELSDDCRNELLKIMNRISQECNGSFTEQKKFTIAWHYRNSATGDVWSRTLIQLLQPLASKYNLKIIDGNKVVEVVNKTGGKEIAVRQLLSRQTYDFILAIGDDTTDEAMFEELNLNDNAITIKVGQGKTAAKNKLSSHEEVIKLLQQL